METNTPLFYVLQVFGMCETTFPGCGTTCVWECCCRVGCSITARVPTSDPSCQEGQLTCRWASSTWGDLGLPAHRGPTEALGTALFLALGSLSAAPILTPGQLCSALFPLLPQNYFVCELSVCISVHHMPVWCS